jgi:hypothetical protein
MSEDTLQKLMCFIPEDKLKKEVKKKWIKKTKFMDKTPIDKKQLNEIITKGTKQTKYKNITAHKWLKNLKDATTITEEQKEFIKWFQTEYPIISFKLISGKK